MKIRECFTTTLADKKFSWIVWALLVVVGSALYWSVLAYTGFRYDGALFLVNNPLFKDFNYYVDLLNVKEFSTLDEQLGLDSDVTTNFMLRPVAYLTFSLNYMFDGLNPLSYRAVNIVIHILNSLLVYGGVSRLLLTTTPMGRMSLFSTRFITTLSALVFLVHPMQTQSVTYITQRFASLAALFYLATIYTYLLWRGNERHGGKGNCLRWLSVALLFLGMMTRESLFTAPFMLLLLEMTVLGSSLRESITQAKVHLALLPVIPVMLFTVSATQNAGSLSLSGAVNVVNYTGTPILHYALTQLVVVLLYLRLYLFPFGQSVEHEQTLYTLPYQLPVLICGVTIVVLVGGAYLLYRKHPADKRHALIFVGICWYFLGVSTSSSVIPLPDLMAEHRAYFPSVGFILALTCSLDLLRTACASANKNRVAMLLVVLWCVVLIMLTNNRNKVWASGVTLWSNAVKHSPGSHRANYNLGVAYIYAKDFAAGLPYLEKSIEIDPDWAQAYEVLGVALIELGRYPESIAVSKRGINIDPANPAYYKNLGIAYSEMDRIEDAREAFSVALNLSPGFMNSADNRDMIESYIESSIGNRGK